MGAYGLNLTFTPKLAYPTIAQRVSAITNPYLGYVYRFKFKNKSE